MSTSPVSVAILGRGVPAHHRFDAIKASQTTVLRAAIDTRHLRVHSQSARLPVHPCLGGLRLPTPNASVWVSPDEQSVDEAIALGELVVLSDPRLCQPDFISEVIRKGKHVLSDYLPTTNSSDLMALYQLADQFGVKFHVSCVSLYEGVPLTLAARVAPVSVKVADLVYRSSGPDPDDVSELVYGNIGVLVHLVGLVDQIRQLEAVSYHQRVLRAEAVTTHDSLVTLTLSQAPDPEIHLDLTITDHATTWRQMNDALYQGRSPQTILQGLNIYQDELSRFVRGIRVQAPMHPSRQLWQATLDFAEALTQLGTGPLI